MIILDVKQGELEWVAARVGLPTASNFDKIVTMKGDFSKQYKKYLYQLAGERVSGIREEGYTNAAMQRGIELESEARSLYEFSRDCKVEEVGLCYQDAKRLFACSPDGLVGKDGGIEIKCPSMAVHVGYLIDDKLPSDYFQQVQGTLFVTGRKWWDFVSYYPGLRPLIVRVKRDEEFIKKLSDAMVQFCKELEETTERIK